MTLVHVGVGSNVDRERNVRSGLASLMDTFGPLRVSRVFESVAVGFAGDPFFNLVVSFETDLAPGEVAMLLRNIERAHGRPAQAVKLAPRTLDLDLLLFGDVVQRTESFHVPREDVTRFAYVLWPLAELDGGLRHPVDGRSYGDIWAGFPRASAPGLAPVDFVPLPGATVPLVVVPATPAVEAAVAPATPAVEAAVAPATPAIEAVALPAAAAVSVSVSVSVPRPEPSDASGLFR